jgi:hypothetical protein
MGERKSSKASAKPPRWISKSMGARMDLADRDALYTAMEQDYPSTEVGEGK